jgi:hypothetical protein
MPVSLRRICLTLTVLCIGIAIMPASVAAQEIDFGKIDKFESVGTGTLEVGAAPKTIVDDGDRQAIVLTIWEADAETKVYWKAFDGNARTTVIPGRGVQTFQTQGLFKLEAVGNPAHTVQYGYLLLRQKEH